MPRLWQFSVWAYKKMDSLNRSLSFWLNYTTRNMRRYASEVLTRENAGITVDQWGVLKLLDEHGGQLSNRRLTELMLKDRPTLTRIVDILCREGMVVRTTDPDDRRRMQLELSTKGRKRITKVGPLVQSMRNDMRAGISKKEHDQILNTLLSLNQKIDSMRENDND